MEASQNQQLQGNGLQEENKYNLQPDTTAEGVDVSGAQNDLDNTNNDDTANAYNEEEQAEIDAINNRRPAFPGADPQPGQQEYSQQQDDDQQQNNFQQELKSTEGENAQGPPLGASNFTDDEVQNLREIFDLFDKQCNGHIEVKDLETIMSSLQRDPSEVREFIENIDPNANGRISFQEFLDLMQQVENKIVKSGVPVDQNQSQQQYMALAPGQHHDMNASGARLQQDTSMRGMINVTADSKVLDFLRLLEEYRRKCEEQGNYAEARKSRSKFDELLKKETQRQRNNIRAAQEQELQNIEAAQKAQFLEFSQAWDNYMSDYEATAYLSLEKLKEKHMLEFQQFQDKIRRELRARMKFSKDLLELRDKESKLVRMKRYEEAEKVKMKADLLEEFERNKLEAEMQAVIQKKEAKLRHQQQLALAALLKRIQRDRNEQLKHRQQDSQRLIQRNKNILNDLLNKQNAETKRTLDNLKQTLGMTKLDRLYEPDAQQQPRKAMQLPSSSQSKKRATRM